jgi:hypothetical protein
MTDKMAPGDKGGRRRWPTVAPSLKAAQAAMGDYD